MMMVFHVVPKYPPTVGGVADYSAILSRRLVSLSRGKLRIGLLYAGKDDPVSEFPIERVEGRKKARALCEAIGQGSKQCGSPRSVVVEYSGYGFSDSGAPWWLARALRQLQKVPSLHVMSIMHELFATSARFWERSFWSGPAQYAVAAAIARYSDSVITTREDGRKFIARWYPGSAIPVCPSFSNVGEPRSVPEWEERERYAVVFGKARRKSAMLARYGRELSRLLESLGIEKVVDIGPELENGASSACDIPVESRGILPKRKVSEQLKRASLGILQYPVSRLTKSSVWAAFAAHGIPTIVIGEGVTPRESGLEEGRHFVRWSEGEPALRGDLVRISGCAREWYKYNARVDLTAQLVLDDLLNAAEFEGE